MSVIRAAMLAEFVWGDDVVLLAMDTAGAADFAEALGFALSQNLFELPHDGVTHDFLIAAGESTVDISETRVAWRLNRTTAREIRDALDEMAAGDRPCHQYVDIAAPADTLLLSRDEYID